MEIIFVIVVAGIAYWMLNGLKKNIDKDHRNNSEAAHDEYEEKDNFERFNFYSAQVLPAQGRYNITYTDQRGLTTKRDITVKRAYEDDGKFAIGAHCHLKNGHRSFIDERIQSAIDLDTGEVINSVAQHAITQHEGSEEGKVWNAIGREVNALYVLVFVSRADGRMLKAERAVIMDYLKRWNHGIELNDNELDEAIKTLGTIDQRQFKKIISDMKSAGDIEKLRDIFDCAKRIVATQKTADPIEKASLEILEATINSKASIKESATA